MLTLLAVAVVLLSQYQCSALRPLATRPSALRAARGPSLSAITPFKVAEVASWEPPYSRKLVYGSLWLALVSFAVFLSPAESTVLDNSLIGTLSSTPFDGTVTPLYAALFNFFPIVSYLYGAVLIPGAKEQRVPTGAAVFASLFIGFFALGAYLPLRDIKTDVTSETRGRGSLLFENKVGPAVMTAFLAFLCNYAVTGFFDGDRLQALVELFHTSKLVSVSIVDLAIMTLCLYDPLREDMLRREWTGPPAWVFAAAPLLGPLAYLLARPALPQTQE